MIGCHFFHSFVIFLFFFFQELLYVLKCDFRAMSIIGLLVVNIRGDPGVEFTIECERDEIEVLFYEELLHNNLQISECSQKRDFDIDEIRGMLRVCNEQTCIPRLREDLSTSFREVFAVFRNASLSSNQVSECDRIEDS